MIIHKRIYNKIKLYIKISTIAIKRNRGIKNTLIKTLKVFRYEGIEGVIQRIFQIREAKRNSIKTKDGFDRNDYTEWIKRYDSLTDEDLEKIKLKQTKFSAIPLISILLPVYNPKPQWLKEAIESVCKQVYPHWELCIADDASTNPVIKKILSDYQKKDKRIKVIFREKNGHISACSNSALELANGEWIALLDHDDIIPSHALYCVVLAINKYTDAKLFYSDEDKIDGDGNRSQPYFKCNWNQDLFYSHNLISHLGVYNTAIVKKINGFKIGMEGSQDHDLALRFIEKIQSSEIVHIPKILYHWRLYPESTSMSVKTKSYALDSGIKAINEHFIRCNIDANAEVNDFAMYRVKYKIPEPNPLVSLIIPTRNGLHLIKQCIDSILDKTTYHNYEIIIIDNNSDEIKTLKYLNKIQANSKIRCIRDENPFNFSSLNNNAVEFAKGEYIGLINSDIEVITPGWIEEMLSLAALTGVGAVGAKLYYPNKTIQHAGVILGIGGVASHVFRNYHQRDYGYFGRARLIQEYSAVTAACLIVKRDIYKQVGGMDESNLATIFNDVDFCLKIRESGYRNIWTPYAELIHHESASRGYEDTPEKIQRFEKEANYMIKKWSKILLNDPAYSPNLTLEFTDFSLAWPPRIEKI